MQFIKYYHLFIKTCILVFEMTTNLQTPIDYLKGVGPNRADLLRSELGI